jgi:hypothetical protein
VLETQHVSREDVARNVRSLTTGVLTKLSRHSGPRGFGTDEIELRFRCLMGNVTLQYWGVSSQRLPGRTRLTRLREIVHDLVMTGGV